MTFAIALGAIYRVESLIRRFGMEHEILVRDYCERHNLKLEDLPTRFRFESILGRVNRG